MKKFSVRVHAITNMEVVFMCETEDFEQAMIQVMDEGFELYNNCKRCVEYSFCIKNLSDDKTPGSLLHAYGWYDTLGHPKIVEIKKHK